MRLQISSLIKLFFGWAYVGLIIYLSLTSTPPQVAEFENGDKVKHLLGYGVLMWYFSQLYVARALRLRFAAGFCLMGIVLEIAQGLGGVRNMEIMDALANAAGVLAGFFAASLLKIQNLSLKH